MEWTQLRRNEEEIERENPFYCNDVVINFGPFSFAAPADGRSEGGQLEWIDSAAARA